MSQPIHDSPRSEPPEFGREGHADPGAAGARGGVGGEARAAAEDTGQLQPAAVARPEGEPAATAEAASSQARWSGRNAIPCGRPGPSIAMPRVVRTAALSLPAIARRCGMPMITSNCRRSGRSSRGFGSSAAGAPTVGVGCAARRPMTCPPVRRSAPRSPRCWPICTTIMPSPMTGSRG